MVPTDIVQDADFEAAARRGAQRLKKEPVAVAARYDQLGFSKDISLLLTRGGTAKLWNLGTGLQQDTAWQRSSRGCLRIRIAEYVNAVAAV